MTPTRRAALRERRMQCGLSQTELAARAGVSRQLVAAELADHGISGAGWAKPDAVSQQGRLRLFAGADPAGTVVAGCDPAFGVAERMLEGLGPRSLLAISAPTDSALGALQRGRVHAAVVHGLTRALPVAPVPVTRWHIARWRVGLAVARGVPGRSLEAVLSGDVPIAQREPAAASQQAFERARLAAGTHTPSAGPTATGHLEAARLAASLGGGGVTNEAAARAFGLRFLALEDHVVELWAAERWRDLPGISALAELLNTNAFTERVAHYGGYDLTHCGEPAETK